MGCFQSLCNDNAEEKYMPATSCKCNTLDNTSPFTLEALLTDPRLLSMFREFAEKEHSASWLFFWCDAESFRNKCTPEKAIRIYNTYLKRDSEREIDISPQIRKIIENNISTKNFQPTLFVHAQMAAFNTLAADSYMRFCSSKCTDYLVIEPNRQVATV